jgi:hypothetical protein
MTRKHYNAMAADLNDRTVAIAGLDESVRFSQYMAHKDTILVVCRTLKADNPAFDRDRFLAACGL